MSSFSERYLQILTELLWFK